MKIKNNEKSRRTIARQEIQKHIRLQSKNFHTLTTKAWQKQKQTQQNTFVQGRKKSPRY